MFRNQYDNDVSTWSPQGRLHQIEYAMEAVKQGTATVGLKSETHAVVVALKRHQDELSAHQRKVLPIDTHCGVSIAGLTADARSLSTYLRNVCLTHKYTYGKPMPILKLVQQLSLKMQRTTQGYGKRPFGVGFLLAGFDEDGTHIFQTCPSANYYDCKAMAIGARSQSARTYLEKNLDLFSSSDLQQLIYHALKALRNTLPVEDELTIRNVTIAYVGESNVLTVLEDEATIPYLLVFAEEERQPSPDGDQ